MFHQLYRELVVVESEVSMELYRRFKVARDPHENVSASFSDIVCLMLVSAAAGIIGDVSYDALKKGVRAVQERRKLREGERDLESELEYVVPEATYAELRAAEYPDVVQSNSELTAEIETLLEAVTGETIPPLRRRSRAKTIAMKRLSKEELRIGALL